MVEADSRELDRFELIAEIASGGMATVFLARLGGAGGFQRLLAIKRLHPHLAKDPDFIEMFLDEARLAARIHHPNVVPILEIGESRKGHYLVMEYVEGDTLGRLLVRATQRGGRVPPGVGIRIVLDALAGLHASHELVDDAGNALHLVHRDVSPQNILVGVDGSARITDFGVAKAVARLSSTRTGQMKGKLAYMAPEQARRGTIDRRADVFAMGIVLWETLAHKRLFKGEDDADTLHRILHEPVASVRAVAPGVPPAIDRVVMRALERDPAARYATASELAEDLEAAARSVSLLASRKDVEAQVAEVIGADLTEQREQVRQWIAESEPSQGMGARTPSAAPPVSPRRGVPVWAVVATVLAAGALVFGATRFFLRPTPVASAGVLVDGPSPAESALAAPSPLSSTSLAVASDRAPDVAPVPLATAMSTVEPGPSSRPAIGWHKPVRPVQNSAAAPSVGIKAVPSAEASAAPSAIPVPDDISQNPYRY